MSHLFVFAVLLLFGEIKANEQLPPRRVKQQVTRLAKENGIEEIVYHDHRRQLATVRYFDKAGRRLSEEHYQNYPLRLKQGQTRFWHSNGQLQLSCDYKNSRLNGPLFTYYPNGSLKRKEYYRQGELQQSECFSLADKAISCKPLISKPQFSGGESKLIDFLRERLAESSITLIDPPAFVTLEATIHRDGTISGLKTLPELTLRPLAEQALNQQLVNALRHLPPWQPALMDDIPFEADILISISLRGGHVSKVGYDFNSL